MTQVANPPVASKKLVDSLTEQQRQEQVNALLAQLEAAKTTTEKKKIRRGLRTRGYYLSKVKPQVVEAAKAVEAQATHEEATKVAHEIVAKFGDGKGKKVKAKKAKAK